MRRQTVQTLVNPQNGNLAFKVFGFENNGHFDHVQRNNYYSLIFINQGVATVTADVSSFDIKENSVLTFSPYQPFMIAGRGSLLGYAIQFHPDFFCIHKHQNEVACNGVLFNNIYSPPFVSIALDQAKQFEDMIEQIKKEMEKASLAQYELLVSHLKIILIHLSRIKVEQNPDAAIEYEGIEQPFILQNLKNAIENNFRTKHSASDYAGLLNVAPKTLAKIIKSHFNKTITDLISERIVIEAKRELYLTSKTVKEIAYELGYDDEYYFSRFFKTNAQVSPQMYRETVGFAAAESQVETKI